MITKKIIIADDHKMIRTAWKSLIGLHKEYEVIDDVRNGLEAIEVIKIKKADILLMDITMPGMNGIEATGIISKMPGAPKIIALSMHFEYSYVEQMFAAGAMGYLSKDASPIELFIAIDEVLDNRKYLNFQMRLESKQNINRPTVKIAQI